MYTPVYMYSYDLIYTYTVHPTLCVDGMCVCPCARLIVDITLSTAVDINAVAVGLLFSSRCRRYRLWVTLHHNVPHSSKHT